MDNYSHKLELFQNSNGYGYKSEAKGVLKGLGFNDDELEKPIKILSGGEKTRVLLAKLLLKKPTLLLLDEPTNHLDSDALEWLELFLKQYKGTVILISHDRYFLDQSVNRIFEIHNKKLKAYNGNYSYYVEKSAIDKEIERKTYEDQQKEIKKQEESIERLKAYGREKHLKRARSKEKALSKIEVLDRPDGERKRAKIKFIEESIERLKAYGREKHLKRARSKEKALSKIEVLDRPDGERKRAKIKFIPAVESGNDVLAVRDVGMRFPDKVLFKDLNLDIYRGEKVALIGPNGAGKSTLFKIIMNELQPMEGEVKFGTNVNTAYFHQEQKTKIYIIQDNNERITAYGR